MSLIKGLFLLLLGTVAGVAVTVLLSRTNKKDLAGEVATLEREVKELSEEKGDAAKLRSEFRALQMQQAAPLRQPAPPTPTASPKTEAASAKSNQTASLSSGERAERRRQVAHQQIEEASARLDQRLRGEIVDREWSNQAQAGVASAFASLPTDHVRQAECRSTLCRVVVEHDSDGDQRAFAAQITSFPPFDQDVLYNYDQTSTPRTTTLYVARAGTSMSSMLQP